MSAKMFVNLPVKGLKKTMAFYKALGFTFNPQFADDTARMRAGRAGLASLCDPGRHHPMELRSTGWSR
jgi:hypothetical protein